MTDIYNGIHETSQNIYDAYNTLMFGDDTRIFNKLLVRTDLYKQVSHLPGDIAEFGVFKGAGLALWLKLKHYHEHQSITKVIGFDFFDKSVTLDSSDTSQKTMMNTVLDRSSSDDLAIDSVKTSYHLHHHLILYWLKVMLAKQVCHFILTIQGLG